MERRSPEPNGPSRVDATEADNPGYRDNAEFWIHVIRNGLDTYRTELTNHVILSAVNPQPGQRILDAGCGEGWLSRACASRGALVTGLDACAEFVEAARAATNGSTTSPTYHLADVRSLPLSDTSLDTVVCNHVLNDIPDPETAIAAFSRVLVAGGRLVALLLHPCFYAAKAERTPDAAPLSAHEYFNPRVVRQPFKIAGITSPADTVTYLYPLEHYTTALTTAGFAITALTEPRPSPDQFASSPWWKDNFLRPLFLLIEATKLPDDARQDQRGPG